MIWIIGIVAWIVLSIPFAIVAGHFFKAGRR